MKQLIEYDLEQINSIVLFSKLRSLPAPLIDARIIYRERLGGLEYITENISPQWLETVDAHTFYVWVELKRAQKQKYNIQQYQIILKLTQILH